MPPRKNPPDRTVTQAERRLWVALNKGETIYVAEPVENKTDSFEQELLFVESSPAQTTQIKRRPVLKPQPAVMPRQALRKLSNNTFPEQDILDLHGHSLAAAQVTLTRFLQEKAKQKRRRVLIITGKGTAGRGLIRQQFPEWLELPALATLVSSYRQAAKNHGGNGAFYVFLR